MLKLLFLFIVTLFIMGAVSLLMFIRSFLKIKKQFDHLGSKDKRYEEIRTTNRTKNKQIFADDEGEYIDFEEEKAE